MAKSETKKVKKQALISKWRDRQQRAGAVARTEKLLEEVDSLNELVGKLSEQDEKIERLEAELDEAREEIKSLEEEADSRGDDLEQALLAVKYWFLDAMVHGKFVKTPREMLQKVEESIGP